MKARMASKEVSVEYSSTTYRKQMDEAAEFRKQLIGV